MTLYNWIRLLITLLLVLLLFLCSAGMFRRAAATGTIPGTTVTAPLGGNLAITEPLASAQLAAGGFTLKGIGKPGETLTIFEDGSTNLGNTVVREDGTWAYDIASPTAGDHTYEARGASGDPASVSVSVAQAEARTTDCTNDYSLSLADGQTISAPFRFGGEGKGAGYSVTVKRGDRVIGTKDVGLDATCGWSYQSNPGVGPITYEVSELGGGALLSTINLNVQ
jgi:hypothetical protein